MRNCLFLGKIQNVARPLNVIGIDNDSLNALENHNALKKNERVTSVRCYRAVRVTRTAKLYDIFLNDMIFTNVCIAVVIYTDTNNQYRINSHFDKLCKIFESLYKRTN